MQEFRVLRKEQSHRKATDSLLRDTKVQWRSLEDISDSGNIITV